MGRAGFWESDLHGGEGAAGRVCARQGQAAREQAWVDQVRHGRAVMAMGRCWHRRLGGLEGRVGPRHAPHAQRENGLEPEGCRALAGALEKMTGLTTLDLVSGVWGTGGRRLSEKPRADSRQCWWTVS